MVCKVFISLGLNIRLLKLFHLWVHLKVGMVLYLIMTLGSLKGGRTWVSNDLNFTPYDVVQKETLTEESEYINTVNRYKNSIVTK